MELNIEVITCSMTYEHGMVHDESGQLLFNVANIIWLFDVRIHPSIETLSDKKK